MRLYVLTEEIDYEGGTPMGIYTSSRAAIEAANKKGNFANISWFRITSFDVDSAAQEAPYIDLPNQTGEPQSGELPNNEKEN